MHLTKDPRVYKEYVLWNNKKIKQYIFKKFRGIYKELQQVNKKKSDKQIER